MLMGPTLQSMAMIPRKFCVRERETEMGLKRERERERERERWVLRERETTERKVHSTFAFVLH